MSITFQNHLSVTELAWNLRRPCADCPFRRDAPAHTGVAESLVGYDESIQRGEFAHTCHKTDNRFGCDGPRNYSGEKTEHCAGALHFLLRAGLGLQLPLLNAAEEGRLDIHQATADAEADETVFASLAEMVGYYLPVLEAEIHRRETNPTVCVEFEEHAGDPPTMLPLSVAIDQGLSIIPCKECGKPASKYDNHWPFFMECNFCQEHMTGGLPDLRDQLKDLQRLAAEEHAE